MVVAFGLALCAADLKECRRPRGVKFNLFSRAQRRALVRGHVIAAHVEATCGLRADPHFSATAGLGF